MHRSPVWNTWYCPQPLKVPTEVGAGGVTVVVEMVEVGTIHLTDGSYAVPNELRI